MRNLPAGKPSNNPHALRQWAITVLAATAVFVSRETLPAHAQDESEATPTVPIASTVVKNRSPIDLTPLPLSVPQAAEFDLPNGIHVLVVENHRTPTVAVSVYLRAGQLLEPKSAPGVAGLSAALLTRGTATRTAESVESLLDQTGARVNVVAGPEYTVLSAHGLSTDTDALVALLADEIQQPVNPDSPLRRGIPGPPPGPPEARQGPAFARADATLRALLYAPDSPYGHSPSNFGPPTDLKTTDVAAFRQQFYRPEGAIIGIAGDIDRAHLRSLLRKTFGDWHANAAAVSEPVLPPVKFNDALHAATDRSPGPVILDRPGSAETLLLFGVPGVRRSDPDYPALYIANQLLGGGFNSRLNQRLREADGFTYGARSTLEAGNWPGIWEATASVRTPVTIPAAREFLDALTRLQTVPPKEGELDLIKQAVVGSFALTLESPESILELSIDRYRYRLPDDYWDTYADRIRAVTPEEVTRVAHRYWSGTASPSSQPIVWLVAVGDRSQIESGLTDLLKPP